MSLSCHCNEWDGEGWAFIEPNDFTTLQTKRRKRCVSCKELMNINSICLEFKRLRYPTDFEIDTNIHNESDEIYISSLFMCEGCGDQYFNLTALGFCILIGNNNMFDLLKEYQELKKQNVRKNSSI